MATSGTGTSSTSASSSDLGQAAEEFSDRLQDTVEEFSGTPIEIPALAEQCESIVALSDIKFEVEDQIIYANKASLSLQSPVFRAMFTSDFKEKSLDVIGLPGKSAAAFVQFINVTHLAIPLTLEIVYAVLPIASEYQCESMLLHCDDFLVRQEFCALNLAFSGQYALTNTLKVLTEKAIDKSMPDLKRDPHFDKVPEIVKIEIYEAIIARQETALTDVKSQLESVTAANSALLPYKEKLTRLTTGLKGNVWPHSKLCVLAYKKNGKCTCRSKPCDHSDKQRAYQVECKDVYNGYKRKSTFRYKFINYGFCADCAVQTLWHIMEVFNNLAQETPLEGGL